MKNWKVWAAFLSVFAAGVIVGVVGFGLVIKHHFRPPKDPVAFQQRIQKRVLRGIIKNVQPDPAAIPAIKEILGRMIGGVEAVRKDMSPRVKSVFQEGEKEIKAHLTPEQAERFDAMIQERKRGPRGFFHLPPPPPPMP